MPILEVTNLSKSFGGIQAVKDISLKIEENQIVGIIGQNGAGKTTFFNLLTGIYSPTSGEIEYNLGKTIGSKDLKPHKLAHYGIARTFQNIRLFKNMRFGQCHLGCHSNLNYDYLLPSLNCLPTIGLKKLPPTRPKLLEEFNLIDKKDELANLAWRAKKA